MNKNFLYILFLSSCVALICACGGKDKQEASQLSPGLGGRKYGGVLHLNETEYMKSLFPPAVTDVFSYRIATQIFEGLFKFDQRDLSLKQSLCEKYSIDSTGTIYTFEIKKGVFFQDNDCFETGKGRQVEAKDFAYCFQFLCSKDVNNHGFSVFRNKVKGANAFNAACTSSKMSDKTIEGIKVLGTHTLQITLEKPSSVFLYDLARPFTFVWPHEAYEKYGLEIRTKPVGTGPFFLSYLEDDQSIILKKNANYFDKDSLGNKLPFLEAIQISFIKEKKAEFYEFKKKKLDLIYRLPTDMIIEILDEENKKIKSGEYTKYQLQRKPEMASHFLTFLNQSPLFKDKNLRKAISYSINRQKLLDYVLMGEGYKAGTNGVTPPIFSGYDIAKIKGFELNKDSAQYFMAKAGFPNGKGFPKLKLELNSDGERNKAIAEEVQKQLKETINIDIELEIVPFAQHIENIVSGKSPFFRIGWIADFPSPETFLSLFYGKDVPKSLSEKSFPNMSRYSSPEYDKYYEKAINASTQKEAYANFMKAEQILMQDAPVIVLWYDEGYRLLQPTVQNFPSNPMQYRDFSQVYLIDPPANSKP